MSHRAGFLLVLVLALAALPGPADARRYYRSRARVGVVLVPSGLYVGGGPAGALVLQQSGGPELLDNGGGLTLFVGLRINPRLALELGWLGTFHNPAEVYGDIDYLVLNGFTGDAKVYFGESGQTAEPYLQGGLGLYLLDSTYFGAQSVGSGFQLGGGYDFFLSQQVSVGVRALYRGIAMGPPDRNRNDTFLSAVTLDGNLKIDF